MAYIDRPASTRRPLIKRRNKPDVRFDRLTFSDPDGERTWVLTWIDSLGGFQITAVMNPGRISVMPVTANSIMLK